MRTINEEARRAKQIEIMEKCYDCYAEYGLTTVGIKAIADALQAVRGRGKQKYEEACRQRAVTCFNKDDRYADYVRLYERIV